MKTRYDFSNKYILRWKHPSFLNSNTLKKKIQNPELILTFNLTNVKAKEYLNLLEGLFFLEAMTGQRGCIKKVVRPKNMSKSGTDYIVQTHLRAQRASMFLDFFYQFVLLDIFKDESVDMHLNVLKSGNCIFLLKDLSFVPGLHEEGLFWKKILKIDIIFKNKNNVETINILNHLGFN